MAYTARITTLHPAAFIIMVDQSGSMAEPVKGSVGHTTKSQAVSQVINCILAEIIARTKGDYTHRYYFDIAVIGYGGRGVYSLLPAGESWFMTPAQLAASVRRKLEVQNEREHPQGRKILTKTIQKIWVEPQAEGTTPMLGAFTKAYEHLRLWCAGIDREDPSFPPVVINITDGEATDGDAESIRAITDKIKSISTGDGNALLFNIHIGGDGNRKVAFPTSPDDLPEDRYARALFNLSSVMPEIYTAQIRELLELDHTPAEGFRGMAYNAAVGDLFTLLNIGSTSVSLII